MQSGDLDSIDLDDPAAVKQALADAATRIRDLERDGVHAIGGVVAEMLDHAAKSGDEILDRARDDAQAIRAAAESAAADVVDQANATAEGIAAKAAADDAEVPDRGVRGEPRESRDDHQAARVRGVPPRGPEAADGEGNAQDRRGEQEEETRLSEGAVQRVVRALEVRRARW